MRILPYFLLLFTLCGCHRKTPIDRANAENRLVLNNKVEPEDLDPQVTTGVAEINIHMALFEGLTSPNPKNLQAEPGVADKWNVTEDGLVYTFHIRDNAKWSNGDPLKANDFEYSWKRMLTEELGAANANMLFVIKGAEAYYNHEIPWNQVGIKTISPYELQVTLKSPTSYFPELLMHPAFYPVHRATIESYKAFNQRATGWTQPESHIGNGPFELKEWRVNHIVRVVKNPFYWDADRVKLNAIDFLPYENSTAEELAFRGNQIHLTRSLPPTKIDSYRKTKSPFLRIDPYLGTYYYILNTRKPPLDDIRVRRALMYALNRQAITENVLHGGEQPAGTFTPPDTAGYTCRFSVNYDLQKARKDLADAGYPNGKGFPSLVLKYNSSDNNRVLAEVVQEMWRKNLGIHIELQNEEWKSYLETRRQLNFDIIRSSWVGDYIDPSTFLDVYRSDNQNNFSGFDSIDYDICLQKAAQLLDKKARFEKLDEAETILLENAPIIPLYYFTVPYLIRPEVKGWYPTLLDWHPYKYVYISKESNN
jgi:oligopeptide transport system substrate-binding protein